MSKNKLQSLLVMYLQKYGSIQFLLPDGVTLEIGVNQLDREGNLKIVDNYCWIMASREDRMAVLDSYNLGVRFNDCKDALIFEDKIITEEGQTLRRLDVV